MSSGDDIEAGRVTTGESTTDLLAAIPSEKDVDFNGVVILRVAPQPGDLKPSGTIDGIHGVGNNGAISAGVPASGGSGVVGFGGPNQGTGLVGRGGGANGTGGFGVHGIGGSQGSPSFIASAPPGTGVVAQGGRMVDNEARRLHGAGVVAVAGGSGRPLPSPAETGSVGVFAVGAEAEISTMNIDGVNTIVGPPFPGAGVVARGGVPIPHSTNPVGAGVIGLAGDTQIPLIGETGDIGVYARGPKGTVAHGEAGRGGIFSTDGFPQVQLVPLRIASPSELKGEAKAGDLLATIARDERGTDIASLWFCTVGGKPNQANWVKLA